MGVLLSGIRPIDVMLDEKKIVQGICPGVVAELGVVVENDAFAGGDVALKSKACASQNGGKRIRGAGCSKRAVTSDSQGAGVDVGQALKGIFSGEDLSADVILDDSSDSADDALEVGRG